MPPSSSGISILITSAPQSASWRTQVGPPRTRVKSSTLKRASAWLAGGRDITGSVGRLIGGGPDLHKSCNRRHLGGGEEEYGGFAHRVDLERRRRHFEAQRAGRRRHDVIPELAQIGTLDHRDGHLRSGPID